MEQTEQQSLPKKFQNNGNVPRREEPRVAVNHWAVVWNHCGSPDGPLDKLKLENIGTQNGGNHGL